MALLLLLAGVAAAQDAVTWHRSLKDGKKAAAASGKPVLVVTTWDKGT